MENDLFEQIVQTNFSDILIPLQFELVVENSNFPLVTFSKNSCIVRFIFDIGLLICDFIDPKEKEAKERANTNRIGPAGYPVYPVYAVWKFLYPNDPVNYSYCGYDMDGQVLAMKKILLERLTNVLNGDFGWASDFHKSDYKLSRKIQYMMTHWEVDNPVRMKFKNGDPTWETHFDKYKNYLDGLQKL